MSEETENTENPNTDDMWAEAMQEQEENAEDSKPESDGTEDAWAAAMQEQSESEDSNLNTVDEDVESASSHAEGAAAGLDEDLTKEIEVEVRIELGRTKMPLGQVNNLNQGAIIELDKDTKQPLDVYINNLLLFRGEVVTVKDNFGLSITERVSSKERARNLSFIYEPNK